MSDILGRIGEIDKEYYAEFNDYPPTFGMNAKEVREIYRLAEKAVAGDRGAITDEDVVKITGAPIADGADY